MKDMKNAERAQRLLCSIRAPTVYFKTTLNIQPTPPICWLASNLLDSLHLYAQLL